MLTKEQTKDLVKVSKLLDKARTSLYISQPFFGTLAMRTPMEWTYAAGPTACTDGYRCLFNPSFCANLTMEEFQFVVVHELYHKMTRTGARRAGRDPTRWGYASDLWINPRVQELVDVRGQPQYRMPKGVLYDKKYAGDEWSTDAIYEDIGEDYKEKYGESDAGHHYMVGNAKDEMGNELTPEEVEVRVARDVAESATYARKMGKLPAHLQFFVDELLHPVVPWKEKLARFLSDTERNDYSFNKPNRRFIAQNEYLPGYDDDVVAMGHIILANDTSGSTMDWQLRFLSEVGGIIRLIRPSITTLIHCDAAVEGVQVFERDEDVDAEDFQPQGGGGTSFIPPFQWVEEQQVRPRCLIYLTDGYGTFPDQAPQYPVLWLINNNEVDPPFGEVIRLPEETANG